MKVVGAELFMVETQMKRSFVSSSGSTRVVRHPVIKVAVEGGNGTREIGWGEAPTPVDPFYLSETPESAWQCLGQWLFPQVCGGEFSDPFQVQVSMGSVKGNAAAKCALDCSIWDAWSRLQGISLARALTSACRRGSENPQAAIHAGASIGMQDAGRLRELVEGCRRDGYQRIKLKVAPGSALEILESMVTSYPSIGFVADANGSYDLDNPNHLDELLAIDGLGLTAIEQPLASGDLVDHSRLQSQLRTAIALDESISSISDARAAVALGACRAVSIKAARLGGYSKALELMDYCSTAGMDTWCGGMHEFGIGRAANIALVAAGGFTLVGDSAGSDQYYEDDLVDPPASVDAGSIDVPLGPGIGCEVLEDKVRAWSTLSQTFGEI